MAERRIREAIVKASNMDPRPSIEEVVIQVSNLTGAKPHHVARMIHILSSEGKLKLQNPNQPRNLQGYFRSHYSLWFWAVVTIVVLTLTSVYALPETPPFIYIRYVVGTIFALYLPGYTLLEALFPVRGDIDALERLAFSIGLSLVLIPLVGLALNYTPWGIRLTSMLTSLTILSIGLSILGAYRKTLSIAADNDRDI